MMRNSCVFFLSSFLAIAASFFAQEKPYFVTYDHHLEDPGDLELGFASTIGGPRSERRSYLALYSEFEDGLTEWWTSELYWKGNPPPEMAPSSPGWRLENRFRPLAGKHFVEPGRV